MTDSLQSRIDRALRRAGLAELPDDTRADLRDHGMDSLLIVLSVAELEREFSISIPAERVSEESFRTLHALRILIEELQ